MTKLDFPDTPTTGQQYGSSGTVWRWDGTRWGSTAGAAGARGRVAFGRSVADHPGITTLTNIAGLTATWTADPSRTYKITGFLNVMSNGSTGDIPHVFILNGSTAIATSRNRLTAANYPEVMTVEAVETGLSGTVTRTIGLVRAAGSGTLSATADPTAPAFILVEDITYEAGSGGPVIDVARLPKGLVNFTSITAAQGGFPTTPVNIATAMTHLFDATRNYEIRASIPVCVGVTATVATCALIASGGIGTLTNGALQLPSNGELGYLHLHWIGNIVNSITLNVSLKSNAGTVTHNAAATAPSTIALYDLGAK